MAGPRLPVACVRSGGQSSLGDITGEISGRARWFICIYINLFSYPSQSDFGDATHLVGDFYALFSFCVDVGKGEIATSSREAFGKSQCDDLIVICLTEVENINRAKRRDSLSPARRP